MTRIFPPPQERGKEEEKKKRKDTRTPACTHWHDTHLSGLTVMQYGGFVLDLSGLRGGRLDGLDGYLPFLCPRNPQVVACDPDENGKMSEESEYVSQTLPCEGQRQNPQSPTRCARVSS